MDNIEDKYMDSKKKKSKIAVIRASTVIQPDGMRVEIAVMSVSWVFCLDGMQYMARKTYKKTP